MLEKYLLGCMITFIIFWIVVSKYASSRIEKIKKQTLVFSEEERNFNSVYDASLFYYRAGECHFLVESPRTSRFASCLSGMFYISLAGFVVCASLLMLPIPFVEYGLCFFLVMTLFFKLLEFVKEEIIIRYAKEKINMTNSLDESEKEMCASVFSYIIIINMF